MDWPSGALTTMEPPMLTTQQPESKPNVLGISTQFTPSAADFMERLAAELEVAPSRYEEATNRYESVGAWLGRDESSLKDYDPVVYVQGSFRLGTPIRPASENEHYDIDLVCELTIGKHQVSQQQLKAMLGNEMRLYSKAHGMKELQEGRRCWILDYADGAQFHLDALPAIPDAVGQRQMLAARSMKSDWAETAIAITDINHPAYQKIHTSWPHSNPRGFTNWFRSRMKVSFNARRGAMALEAKASVEDVPAYRVKTPLQQCIQILKRHRDLMFLTDSDNKPISVIITTLAALAYNNESTVSLAMATILQGMDSHIKYDAYGNAVIANPTDPSENFADKWPEHPQRRTAFFKWLETARKDFAKLARQGSPERLIEAASGAIGDRFARNAAAGVKRPMSLATLVPRIASALTASHRQAAPWPLVQQGTVSVKQATWTAKGFSRPIQFKSDAAPLLKNASLTFRAETNVPAPYDIYWQVVNTGSEAKAVNGLRGGFDAGAVDRGAIVRREGTSYSGSHTIECFIVKNGYLVARSGLFIVNIR